MKILVIHQHYLSAGQPGGSRFNEFARIWRAAGHDVTVIAGTLNYATGEVPPELAGRWLVRRTEDGITVWRCHVSPAYSRGYLGRMWAFCSFTVFSSIACVRTSRPDVVIATSPPLTVGLTGWCAARRHRVPWVFEVRDLWPESAITTGVLSPGGVLTKLLYAIERFCCRHADRVSVLTPAFADDLERRGLVDRARLSLIPNGADATAFTPGPRQNAVRQQLGWGDRFVALYAGAHGRANAIMQLVDAADVLRGREDILIASVGDGPDRARCEQAARERGLANIVFLGPRPKREMPALVQAADAGLAVLQDNPTFRTVYPNKVFDYMASERPTLVAIDGVARRLVCDEAAAGIFARPEDAASIAEGLVALADDPERCRQLGRTGRAWVLEHATRQALAEQYLDVLRTMVRAAA